MTMKLIDLTGMKFGKLTVIKRSAESCDWLCQCECGKTKLAKSNSLKSGRIKSCGCLYPNRNNNNKYVDLTGKIFNKLTVEKRHDNKGKTKWECVCECGVKTIVISEYLKNGHTQSCGCIKNKEKSKKWSGYQDISGKFWNRLKYSAKERKLDFNLDIEYLWELYLKQNRKCALSGIDIIFATKSLSKDGTCSLDRKDSSMGYIKDNVQWVHKEVNKIKQDLSDDKLIYWCRLISNNRRDSNSKL